MRGTFIRLAALVMSLVLLCGCAAPFAGPKPSEQTQQVEPSEPAQKDAPAQSVQPPAQDAELPGLVGGGYLPRYARTELPYSEMQLSGLTEEDVERLCEALPLAAESGSQAKFHRAFTAAFDALYALECDCTLRTLASNADAADLALSSQAADSETLLNTAYDRIFLTLKTLSRSGDARLLQKEAPDWLYPLITDYDTDSSADLLRLSERETGLEQEYERLSAQEQPDREALSAVFLELVQLRNEIAALRGYADYPTYAYAGVYGRTYTPQDAETVWKTAKEDFAPVFWAHYDAVEKTLLRAQPSADCSEAAILNALDEGTAAISPELHEICEYMIRNGLYDLSASEKKLDIGYTVWLSGYDVPFIFHAGQGFYPDYQTVFHEFGHFVGAYCNGSDALFGVCDLDLSELQSQGMEVLFLDRYDEIFGEAFADALVAEKVLDFVYSIVTGAMFDEFQQRVYREPDLTAEKVSTIYAELRREYGFREEAGSESRWMNVIHNFEYPLYYISYAVSAFPALELFLRQQDSPADAADTYLRVAAMGDESYTLEEVIQASGFVNVLRSQSGDLIAAALESSGVFDGF